MKRLLLCLLSLLLSRLPARTAEELRAGSATVDITPPAGFAMWGYAARKDQPSLGIRDPLRARALVLAAGDKRLALVSLDLGDRKSVV